MGPDTHTSPLVTTYYVVSTEETIPSQPIARLGNTGPHRVRLPTTKDDADTGTTSIN